MKVSRTLLLNFKILNLKKENPNKLNQQFLVMHNFRFQEGTLEYAQKEACWTG